MCKSNHKIQFTRLSLITAVCCLFFSNSFAAEYEKFDTEQLKLIEKEKKIYHPYGKKGLIRISKDRSYYYKVESTEQTGAASFRLGFFQPTKLENPETGIAFEDLYKDSDFPALMFDYEWQLVRGSLGKIGLRVGSGLYVAQGNGAFKSTSLQNETPKEEFTFILFPNTVNLVYRFMLSDTAWLSPFVSAGGGYFIVAELRDDDKEDKFGGAAVTYASAGLAFSLNQFAPNSIIELDREYGINNVWLTGEYRYYVGLDSNLDFTSNYANLGFLLEF